MLGTALACAALGLPAVASAADQQALQEYQYVVDRNQAGLLAEQGVELDHTGFDSEKRGVQRVVTVLYPSQAKALADKGLEYSRLVTQEPQAPVETGGDSPNPYYDVFRSYSEPGGVADEMRALAAENRDVMKLVQIGTSRLGKPILAIKMTADARNVADGTRKAVLYSSVNHAREWIAAEVGRRLPRWFAERKRDPQMAEMLKGIELWFLPIQNPDGYDYTFTCGRGDLNRMCGHGGSDENGDALGAEYISNRLWRKTLRDNNGNGIYGDRVPVVPGGPEVGDGVDPNRNYPTAWNLDEEGASNNPTSEVYRGPAPLSEPENLAYDRLLRKLRPAGLINYHSAAQLLLYPFGYITDVPSDDNPWFVAMTGTDGDAAVDPYTPQRSSDLYVTNGETTDHAYNKYASMAWTPELDTCATAAGGPWCATTNPQTNNSGFYFPDDESKVRAVFEKNLDFARNVAATLASERPDQPKNATDNPSTYQVKGVPDIEVNAFSVSYGGEQTIEANVRKALGAPNVQMSVASGPGGGARTIVLPMSLWEGGERFGDLRGRFYHRVRATAPADFRQPGGANPGDPRPLVAGDVVTTTIRAGGQRQVFRYRVQATQQDPAKQRVLVVAAEDYTGASPNRGAGYDTAPRYLAAHVASLEAAGYEVETYDVDDPPAGADGQDASKIVSALGVLKHFDAVLYYTGDDLVAQDVSEANPRRADTATATGTFGLTGSLHLAQWGVRNAQMLRDYINERGKVILAGRNAHHPLLSTSTSLTTYSGYGWWQDPAYGFDYPAGQAGNDDRPHTAYFRELSVSNDFEQWFLGVAARQGGYGTTTYDASTASAAAGGIFEGMGPIAIDTAPGDDPNETAGGEPDPRAKAPTRLRSISSVTAQRPFRQERVELDYTTPATTLGGGAAISTRDSIAFGFGFEQLSAADRDELLERSLAYLAPTTADTTAPTVSWWRPEPGHLVTPADPVEIEVEAVDERGDMREVRLLVGGSLVERKVSFPFQMRWQPTMADVGSTRTLVVEAEDAAGNVTTSTRDVTVAAPAETVESPLPARRARIDGLPVVGQALRCDGAFVNTPTSYRYAWFRNGSLIVEKDNDDQYVAVTADAGADLTCRVTAINASGEGDSTSEARTMQLATTGARGGEDAEPGPQGPAGPRGPAGPASPRARVTSVMRTPKVTPKRDTRVPITIRTSGRVAYPSGVSRAEACSGRVTITVKAGKRTLSRRNVSLSSACAYRSSVKFTMPSRFGSAKALRVIARFQGNSVLRPDNAPRVMQVAIR